MNGYFILDKNGNHVAVEMLEWARWFEGKERFLWTDIINDGTGDVRISTIFLGVDHSHGGGVPVLYETMIFGGGHDDYQERYCTREEAKKGHEYAVGLVKGRLKGRLKKTEELLNWMDERLKK